MGSVSNNPDRQLRTLRKSFFKLQILTIKQYIVEQAPLSAKYSRGRLIYVIFPEVSNFNICPPGKLPL